MIFGVDYVVDVDIWIDDWPLGITHELKGATYVADDKTKKIFAGVMD